MKFRPLTASEIDCRVSTINEKGLSLLLYKDARVDMNILDETVGAMNWQRSHTRDNANCIVSIWDDNKGQWISKEDTGTESYTEKEKGLASDSFKRACTNWGIGRELYTAPFIWIASDKFSLAQKNNKYTTYDKFVVKSIEIQDGAITDLAIVNERTGVTVYKMRASGQKLAENEPKAKANEIICLNCKNPIQGTVGKNGVSYSPREIYNMTKGLCTDCYKQFKAMNGGKQ